MKKTLFLICMLLLIGGIMITAHGEEAQDITDACEIDVSVFRRDLPGMLDEDSFTKWETGTVGGFVEVLTPAEKPCQGVSIQWSGAPIELWLQIPVDGSDMWKTVQRFTGTYYNQYLAFEKPQTHFRLHTVRGTDKMSVGKLQVLGMGDIPEWVQQWQPFEGKADLMVLVAHPDDELIFMGGVIPNYNTIEGKKVVVVYVASMPAYRKCELLSGLWHCGVRMYPEMPSKKFWDKNTQDLNECLHIWNEQILFEHVTEVIRKYKPDVIVTHDTHGEYGHGAHKACNWAVRQCIEKAANKDVYETSAQVYGTWQVKKVYIHLYEGKNNQGLVQFDWTIPQETFGGRSLLTVASEAFQMHNSQVQKNVYKVEAGGQYDNGKFGLYYSTVGPDSGENDFFENLNDTQEGE